MKAYEYSKIESFWQETWDRENILGLNSKSNNKKFYN